MSKISLNCSIYHYVQLSFFLNKQLFYIIYIYIYICVLLQWTSKNFLQNRWSAQLKRLGTAAEPLLYNILYNTQPRHNAKTLVFIFHKYIIFYAIKTFF